MIAIVVFVICATTRVVANHDICASCGTDRTSTSVLRIPLKEELEVTSEARWMLDLAADAHEHVWVFSHETWWGLTSAGVACGMPEEASLLYELWSVRERVGEDPVLVSLVTEFMSVAPSDAERRREIVERASSLGSAAGVK